MAGPDELDGVGLKLNLPRPRHSKLSEYKVAVWTSEAMAPVSQETQDRVAAVAKTISDAGGTVDFDARPDIDMADAHDIFRTLLWSAMAARRTAASSSGVRTSPRGGTSRSRTGSRC